MATIKTQTKDTEVSLSEMGTQFHQTKVRFREFANYERPLTYEEWMTAPDECKAAILYVQFYDQITLAWNKLHSVYSDINDGVSEVLQYLNKGFGKDRIAVCDRSVEIIDQIGVSHEISFQRVKISASEDGAFHALHVL